MNVWMRVSKDKYEFPEVIADSIYELAEKCGTSVNSIRSQMSHYKAGRLKRRYVCVDVPDDDPEILHEGWVYERGDW